MLELFRGLEEAHNVARAGGTSGGKKVEANYKVVRSPAGAAEIADHLSGKSGIGIVPLDRDGMCRWGAIDVDRYPLDLGGVAERINAAELPLVTCRSKSGGAHCFLFLASPVSASDLQRKLKEIAASLELGDAEIFPKQTEIKVDRGDVGNALNLPYQNAKRTTRYGVKTDGSAMTLDEFLDLAEGSRVADLDSIKVMSAEATEFSDGPPCLEMLAPRKFGQGVRNDALFNLGVYYRQSDPGNWEARVEDANHRLVSPPLPSQEVQNVIKALRGKSYFYTCNRPPISKACNNTLCRAREFGVGTSGGVAIASITKLLTDPPLFFVDIEDGGRLELTSDDLLSQYRFQKACIENLSHLPPRMKETAWHGLIRDKLAQATVIDAPEDSSAAGAFKDILEGFLTQRAQATKLDEVLLGKPFFEEDSGTTWFRLADLRQWMNRERFFELNRAQIVARLRDLGAEHKFRKVRTRGVNLWGVPFEQDSEPYTAPKVAQEIPF
ncbi:MAG: hypothetical protein P8N94_15650 [Gammaproteobacteria bacterium]|nr:hypothetical protein [Gammaproteobacteria bacterium]